MSKRVPVNFDAYCVFHDMVVEVQGLCRDCLKELEGYLLPEVEDSGPCGMGSGIMCNDYGNSCSGYCEKLELPDPFEDVLGG